MAIAFECKKNGNNKTQRSREYDAILNMTPKHVIRFSAQNQLKYSADKDNTDQLLFQISYAGRSDSNVSAFH